MKTGNTSGADNAAVLKDRQDIDSTLGKIPWWQGSFSCHIHGANYPAERPYPRGGSGVWASGAVAHNHKLTSEARKLQLFPAVHPRKSPG